MNWKKNPTFSILQKSLQKIRMIYVSNIWQNSFLKLNQVLSWQKDFYLPISLTLIGY